MGQNWQAPGDSTAWALRLWSPVLGDGARNLSGNIRIWGQRAESEIHTLFCLCIYSSSDCCSSFKIGIILKKEHCHGRKS